MEKRVRGYKTEHTGDGLLLASNKSPFPGYSLTKKRLPGDVIFKGVVPKLTVTSNEKYLARCLELVVFNGQGDPHPRGVFVNYPGGWMVGTTMSGTMTVSNILNSPFYKTLKSSPDFEKSLYSNSITSYSNSNSGPFSSSSSPSSFSSFACPLSRGILRCTWKHGIPHYTLSVDEKSEVYTACSTRIEHDSPNFVYLFRSNLEGEGHRISGKMTVLTSVCFATDGTKVKETEFVLSEVPVKPEKSSLGHCQKRSKGFTEKVVGALKRGHNLRRRTISKFDGRGTIRELGLGLDPNLDDPEPDRFEEDPYPALPPNFETAAILVKEEVRESRPEVGGWGMMFLRKKGRVGCDSASCWSSVDIIVPAGIHGGPRPGGPSGLLERWRSGGSCDCGGWDVGCPLDVLKTCSIWDEDCTHGKFKTVDVFKVGRVRNFPALKMEKIYDDLYRVHFGNGLSPLQSFSIALAIIHTRNPTLRPGI